MWTSQMQMSAAEVLQAIGGGTGKQRAYAAGWKKLLAAPNGS